MPGQAHSTGIEVMQLSGTPPRLLSLATAVPPHVLHQAEVMTRADRIFRCDRSEIERMVGVFANAGIDTRYACAPLEWYARPRGWAEKNRLYLENAVTLLERATVQALNAAGLCADDVDGIITVSTTGLATPSLDALLMERLPFRRNVWRLPVFGLGRAGGVLGFARAAQIARADPDQRALLLVVELCTLTFRSIDRAKSNIIATALLGDGAAAAVIGCSDGGPELSAWGEHCWPASLDIMRWHIEDDGLGVRFSRDIPELVRGQLRPAADAFLRDNGLSLSEVRGFICHPGGAKVLDALEATFDLPAGAMTDARLVLREYGNMSAATVMFVLDLALRAERKGLHLMAALGPGFTAAFGVIAL